MRRLGYLALVTAVAAALILAAILTGEALGDRLGGDTIDPAPTPITVPVPPTSVVEEQASEANRVQLDAEVTLRRWHELRALLYG